MDKQEKIDLLNLLEQKERLQKEKHLQEFQGSIVQNAYVCSTAKIAICSGANQSGKSSIGAIDTEICLTGIVPDSLKDIYPESKIKKGEYWVSSLGYKETLEITKPKVFFYLPSKLIQSYNKLESILDTVDGGKITFKSQEAGRDKYQGAVKDGVWLDEEHEKAVWDECYMRTVAKGGWLRMTFTPLKGLTWAYSELYLKAAKYISSENTHGIKEEVGMVHTLEEIKLLKDRKLVVRENTSTEADPNIEFYSMTLYDNPTISDEEIQKTERKFKDDMISYQARILGKFSKITGRNVFNDKVLIKLQSRVATKFKRYEIRDEELELNTQGRFIVFKDKKPNGNYLIGADVAEGLETGDYSCAQIIERETCEQVAMWHGHCSPEEFGRILYSLGVYYNYGWLAPERNFHGFGVVNQLRSNRYRRLYYDYDVPQQILKRQKVGERKFGWETNRRTRPILIQDLAQFLNEEHLKINDAQTIEELFTFIYDKDGNTGAMGGCHDDRVIALGIALQLYKRTSSPNYRDEPLDYRQQPNSDITGY